MASGPFKCHFSALMWPHNTLKKTFLDLKNNKRKVFIKHIERSDVLVECDKLAGAGV